MPRRFEILALLLLITALGRPAPAGDLEGLQSIDIDPARFVEQARSGSYRVTIDGQLLDLLLEEYDLIPPGARVMNHDGHSLTEVGHTTPMTFRGSVDGQEGSYLHLTVCSDLSWVRGFVSCGGHWYFIQPRSEATPASGRAELVVYQPHELVGGDGPCKGAADGQVLDDHLVERAGGPSRGNLWLYPVVDSEFIAINPDNWYDRMMAQIGNVASLYFNRNIVAFVVEETGTFTGCDDTYGPLILGAMVDAYNRNHDRRQHIVHLLTGKDLDGTDGGVGYLSQVGRFRGYSLAQMFTSMSDYQRMILSCHELGHNFNASHGQAAQGSHWNILCGFVGYTIMSPNFITGCMLDYFSSANAGDMTGFLQVLDWSDSGPADFQLNDGDTYTTSSTVQAVAIEPTFYGNGHSGVYVLSNSAASGLALAPFQFDYQNVDESWSLSEGDGVKVVYLYAYDANEWNLSTTDTIILDTTPPGLVPSLASPTHVVGEPSADYLVEATWESANDQTAGVAGYSVLWSDDAQAEPDDTVDLGADILATVSNELPDGQWYLSIRALDHAGLAGETSRIGPFVIDAMIGVAIDELPPRLTLLGNYPNPFNPSTTIEYTVPSTGPLHLTVYDLRGRPRRVLVNEDRVAGVHIATWDGRDADGRRVASGTYFCRLTAAGESVVSKMVLVQ